MQPVSPSKVDLVALLDDRGYRLTGPRREVVALIQTKGRGFSIEEVSSELPGVGRATVYRTVKLLLEEAVLCKLALPDGAPRYSLGSVGHHHHTFCVKCGTVGAFRAHSLERCIHDMGGDIPGEIMGHRVEIYII